jgi:hypothetical protein
MASTETAVKRGPLLKRLLAPFWSEEMKENLITWLPLCKEIAIPPPDKTLVLPLLEVHILSGFLYPRHCGRH